MEYTTKDSGQREEYRSGMRRDIQTGKPRFDLIPRFMLLRWAGLLERGAQKYGEDNWTLADSLEEWKRFRASAFRHFVSWLDGEADEDHAAAIFFNVSAGEMIERKLKAKGIEPFETVKPFNARQ